MVCSIIFLQPNNIYLYIFVRMDTNTVRLWQLSSRIKGYKDRLSKKFSYLTAAFFFSLFYNNYIPLFQRFITWLLPIIAIISAWVNFLYILRKSPSGIYILMMARILYSFSQVSNSFRFIFLLFLFIVIIEVNFLFFSTKFCSFAC